MPAVAGLSIRSGQLPLMHPASRVREDDTVFVILPVELLRCELVDQANASSNSFSEAFTLVTFGKLLNSHNGRLYIVCSTVLLVRANQDRLLFPAFTNTAMATRPLALHRSISEQAVRLLSALSAPR
jgi:hypothetical protein